MNPEQVRCEGKAIHILDYIDRMAPYALLYDLEVVTLPDRYVIYSVQCS